MLTTYVETPEGQFLLPALRRDAPRPSRSDPGPRRVAARDLARHLARECPAHVAGIDEDDLADLVERAAPGPCDDGLAVLAGLRYALGDGDAGLVEALDAWSAIVSRVVEDDVRRWVLLTAPPPPFEAHARCVHRGDVGPPREGVAFHDPRDAGTARCAFVPDEARAEATSGGRLRRWHVVAWESLSDVRPSDAASAALVAATLAGRDADARQALARVATARGRAAFERLVATRAHVAEAEPASALRLALGSCLRAVDDGSFDPLGTLAADLAAASRALRDARIATLASRA